MSLYGICEMNWRPVTPALIVVLSGARDASHAQADVLGNLLRDGHTELAATFDVDNLLGYRTHPPMQILGNGRTGEVMWPEIRAGAGRDRHGQDLLLPSARAEEPHASRHRPDRRSHSGKRKG